LTIRRTQFEKLGEEEILELFERSVADMKPLESCMDDIF